MDPNNYQVNSNASTQFSVETNDDTYHTLTSAKSFVDSDKSPDNAMQQPYKSGYTQMQYNTNTGSYESNVRQDAPKWKSLPN